MKVVVYTEDKFTAVGLKKIVDIMKKSKRPDSDLNSTFPDRYKCMTKVSKKLTNIYFDSVYATGHAYEMEV